MSPFSARCLTALAGVGLLAPTLAVSQPEIPLSSRAQPKTVPVAETKLLMDGLANANYRGLEKLLKGNLEDAEGWTFARGQALLIAETGNLLLLRPPKTNGQEAWNKSSVELREAATRLARAAAARDMAGSRAQLGEMATACNKCHQSFRVPVQLTPFADDKKPAPAPPK
jgi:hypothetical protein